MGGMTRAGLWPVLRHPGMRTAAAVLGAVLLVPLLGSPGQAVSPPAADAYAIQATGSLAGVVPINVAQQAASAYPSGPASANTANLANLGTASTVATAAAGDTTTNSTTASSSVAGLNIPAVLSASAVTSSCTADGGGTTATTNLVGLQAGGIPVSTPNPAPNSVTNVAGIATITENEQVVSTAGARNSISVNALHISANVLGVITADIIVGHSACAADAQAPTVGTVTPTSGPAAGGTSVTITGSGFTGVTGASSVVFGSTPATSYTVVDGQTITAVAPAGIAGITDVRVTNATGQSAATSADQFTYMAVPAITSLTPATGPAAAGTIVTINGTALTGATAVTFGGVPATGVSVNAFGTQITASAPAGTVGTTVDVQVATPSGTSPVVPADQFSYVALAGVNTPDVSGISPTSGPAAGGTSVIITGTDLDQATSVHLGASSVSFTINSPTQITATAPAHGPGSVDITVTSPGGTSATSPADVYTYVAAPGPPPVTAPAPAPPVMGGVSPSRAPVDGGTLVTLTGSNFDSATGVRFGTVLGMDFTVINSSTITVRAPAHSRGQVEVTVLGPGGSSGAAAFSYLSASDTPAISTASPAMGPIAGGTQITITGTGFDSATTVTIGGQPGNNVQLGPLTDGSARTLTVTVPAHSAGRAAIVVTNAGGATTAAQRFTYLPPLTAATLTLTIRASKTKTVAPEADSNAGAGVTSCSSARTTIAADLGGCVYTAPATAGSDRFTMAVTDQLGQTATQQVNVVITAAGGTGGNGGTGDNGGSGNHSGTSGSNSGGTAGSGNNGGVSAGNSGGRGNTAGNSVSGGSGGSSSANGSGDSGSKSGSADSGTTTGGTADGTAGTSDRTISNLGTGGDELNASKGHPMWLWLALLAAATLCYFIWAFWHRRNGNDENSDRIRYEQMMAAGGSPEHLRELSERATSAV